MATRLEKINGIDDEIAQLRKRQTLLRQQQNKQDRKDRTHRFCVRGGIVEKLLPDLARLDDEQFQIFVDKAYFSKASSCSKKKEYSFNVFFINRHSKF